MTRFRLAFREWMTSPPFGPRKLTWRQCWRIAKARMDEDCGC